MHASPTPPLVASSPTPVEATFAEQSKRMRSKTMETAVRVSGAFHLWLICNQFLGFPICSKYVFGFAQSSTFQ
jgi:hypothetical protein